MVSPKNPTVIAIALVVLISPGAFAAPKLVVHEWGTFTALQDESGKAIGGINTDDEPVPDFVYNMAPKLLFPATEPPPNSKGGIRRCHAQVTMRLETPVVYFYPNDEFSYPFNVAVNFWRGWLTQYFPKARAQAFGLRPDGTGMLSFGDGRLEWNSISLSASNEGPATNSLVWTTPRQVDAATVEIGGEHEKFLFYRGVANRDAPVQVVRRDPEFIITRTGTNNRPDEIHQLWLVDVRSDGTAAFRVLQPFTEETAFLVKTPSHLAPEEYSADAVNDLRSAMRKALIEAGLFEKEADAMLNTWQVSYFQSPGLRLFFLVPRKWTDRTIPLRVSITGRNSRTPMPDIQPKLTRVMVGRIEIVTQSSARSWRGLPVPVRMLRREMRQLIKQFLQTTKLGTSSSRPTSNLVDFGTRSCSMNKSEVRVRRWIDLSSVTNCKVIPQVFPRSDRAGEPIS